jgi:hypothetical protein
MNTLGLKPNQIEILKTIKFNVGGRRRINAQLYGVIFAIFYDNFYESEVKRNIEILKSGLAMPSLVLSKEAMTEYRVKSKADMTEAKINEIATDQADNAIDIMTRMFFNRDFNRHLDCLTNISLTHESSLAYVERLLGIKIQSKEQVDALRQFYNSITKTLDATVGF